MKKASLLIIILVILAQPMLIAQEWQSKIRMQQGAVYEATTEVTNVLGQQVNGVAFNFTLTGKAISEYTVTNATEDNTTLRHKMQHISYIFDGMGSKNSFNSDNKKDLDREFARPLRDMLLKSYDMIIDSVGITRLVLAPTAAVSTGNDQFQVIAGLLGELGQLATAPKKGDPTLFMAWPGGTLKLGESWTIVKEGEKDNYKTVYRFAALTDSTYSIEFNGTGTKRVEQEMRGSQFVMNMKLTTSGTILVNRSTGIIKEKTTVVESSGQSEILGTNTPVNGKMTSTVTVRQKDN